MHHWLQLAVIPAAIAPAVWAYELPALMINAPDDVATVMKKAFDTSGPRLLRVVLSLIVQKFPITHSTNFV
jgi:thiamine pyrophosphate-dependent acetolactate synthase large subunit-like protein